MWLAVPTRGSVNANHVFRMMELLRLHPDLPLPGYTPGHLSVANGRNTIVQHFLTKTTADVLVMVDDDVVPPVRLLELADSDYDITGIPYLYWHQDLNIPVPAVFKINDKGNLRPLDKPFGRTGIVECDAMGTGVIAIKRHVFEHPDMKAPFAIHYDDNGVMVSTDDIAFCNRARVAGFKQAVNFDLGMGDHFPSPVSLNRLFAGFSDAYSRAAKNRDVIAVPNYNETLVQLA